ncbi:uncharacterized protein LOC131022323 [Salvia miltiorrhiza]|uniref:uncharacterized protein LOC131022323 n=1 Tax=Salvia miltiorrhiza TaxID=226208 RepID=UPI0025AD887B|nr:uncharacterized protein LOC131022323 [Salvia miltiorrhiza]XP_057807754.1 uncharacterized protein LOC131022323 [Salvia miltiorrhiza]XP_057807755.1 uncharacterized protein LOC131022323 [Salvia miltiorrhiza]
MNGTSNNHKSRNFEKTYPGCLGRMVNLFELNIGISADRLLTDKPHRDGSPVSRSRSDVSSMGPSLDQIEEKVIVSEYPETFLNKRTNVTPVKMLIAQEMCKEVDSRRSPPNLVAKLMGLDSLPQQEPGSATQRNHSKGGHPRRHSEIPMSNWEQQNGFFHYVEPDEFKDVYEIWQQSKKPTRKGRYDETTKDRKMAFVRQKFVEAKRLSMDEKLRQSKQFQDALEVLNSNKDLFLKCLQEPNSAFSQQLYNLQSIPPPPETKRITVLRPSKMAGSLDAAGAGNREEKQMEKCAFVQLNGLEKGHLGNSPSASWKNYENPTQPTRIVVLKPSLGKILDDKAVGSPQSQSARVHGEEFFGDEEDNENQESREVAKAITQQMREKLGRHHRDETLISSVFSNGYVADESSFNRSEIEYPAGNLSDSEAVSPVSRHSWDYVNRLGSPYSSSSFSRASYSPESSVCREAKKRLSERWAMMASSGSCQEQRHVRRSSSTLGEMLALSETKKVSSPGEEGSSNQESKDVNSLLFSEQRTNRNVDSSTINLTRSKSLPVSSNKLGTGLHADVSVSQKDKIEVSKEDRKVRSPKSSFKGKVSSFFSSRNKKASKENFLAFDTKDECRSCPGDIVSGKTESLIDKGHDSVPADLLEPSIKSSSNLIFKQGLISPEAEFSVSEPNVSGNLTENQDQPSPISVLDPPFEECDRTMKVFPHYGKPDQHGYEMPLNAISSNLIDKSPPIGSIARTLSWDDSCMDTASSYPMKESSIAQGTEEGAREWVLLVETLLSVAGLQGEVLSNSFLARWHSPESPLNPLLRDKYIDLNDKDTVHEAKRRQKRSMQKLVFDCVNAVLVEVAGYGPGTAQRAIPCMESHTNILDSASSTMLEEVWARMSAWFSSEVKCDGGDDNSLVVERVVRKEVVGSGWVDHLRLEVDNLGKEIEVKLVEELVQEAVIELTGRE